MPQPGQLERLLAVRRLHDAEPRPAQDVPDQAPDVGVVVGDEHERPAHGRSSSSTRSRSSRVPNGLRHVPRRARRVPARLVLRARPSGHEQHRHRPRGRMGAQAAGQLVAVQAGHRHVEHRQVGRPLLGEPERLLSVAGQAEVVTAVPQRERDELPDVGVVVGDEDDGRAGHAASSRTGEVAPTGRRTPNTEPAPGWLSTVTLPPCASTIARAIASPRPVPWIAPAEAAGVR